MQGDMAERAAWGLPVIPRDVESFLSVSQSLNAVQEVIGDQQTIEFLRSHLEDLRNRGHHWVVPSPNGLRWNANDFGKRLHELNDPAELPFTAQDFRHTYATDKITEGWPLRVLAQQMGTSVKMLEMHYAAFIPPEALKYTKPPGSQAHVA